MTNLLEAHMLRYPIQIFFFEIVFWITGTGQLFCTIFVVYLGFGIFHPVYLEESIHIIFHMFLFGISEILS